MGQEILNLEFYSFSPTFDDPPAGKSSKSRKEEVMGQAAMLGPRKRPVGLESLSIHPD